MAEESRTESRRPEGRDDESGSALMWSCFVNWALTLEKIRKDSGSGTDK